MLSSARLITIAPPAEQFAERLHSLLVNRAQTWPQVKPSKVKPKSRDVPARTSPAHQTDAVAYGQITEDLPMHQPKALRRRARAIAIAAITPATAPLEALTGLTVLALAAALLLHVF
ncbi:MAG TPA: hypothetical protein VN229_04705 [Terriglobales bacterium]|nr:hypothetical protein [Terriglobales bacterium]